MHEVVLTDSTPFPAFHPVPVADGNMQSSIRGTALKHPEPCTRPKKLVPCDHRRVLKEDLKALSRFRRAGHQSSQNGGKSNVETGVFGMAAWKWPSTVCFEGVCTGIAPLMLCRCSFLAEIVHQMSYTCANTRLSSSERKYGRSVLDRKIG